MGVGLNACGFIVAAQVAGWAVSAALQTEHFYDLTGALTYLAVAAGTLLLGPAASGSADASGYSRRLASSLMLAIWAARLGAFLFNRVTTLKADSRFERVKRQPIKFLIYWLMQALWIIAVSAPLLVVNSAADADVPAFGDGLFDVVGGLLWAAGFVVEAVADQQKMSFRLKPENKGKFVQGGLWSVVRFPNYAGEITLQAGAALVSFSVGYAGFVAPVVTFILLTYLSGIPFQRAQAKRRWADNADYQKYLKNTPYTYWPKIY